MAHKHVILVHRSFHYNTYILDMLLEVRKASGTEGVTITIPFELKKPLTKYKRPDF